MIDTKILTIDFDTADNDKTAGYYIRDWFSGHELLEGAETFLDRVNASFVNRALAIDWLRKSYKGRDTEGVGITVDGDPL